MARKKRIESEELKSFLDQGMSFKAIAKLKGIDRSAVSRAAQKFGLRKPGEPEQEKKTSAGGTLEMLHDSLIEVRKNLLKRLGKDTTERTVETLSKLSAEIRQVALAIQGQRLKLAEQETVFKFFAGVFAILKEEVPLDTRKRISGKIIKIRNAIAESNEVQSILAEEKENE